MPKTIHDANTSSSSEATKAPEAPEPETPETPALSPISALPARFAANPSYPLPALSEEAKREREPLPWWTLIGALHDTIHKKETVFRVPRLARRDPSNPSTR